MTKVFYVVEVRFFDGSTNVFQEAFPSLAAAQAFCAGREDNPAKIDEFSYRSLIHGYSIHSVYVRGDV